MQVEVNGCCTFGEVGNFGEGGEDFGFTGNGVDYEIEVGVAVLGFEAAYV